VFCFTLSKSHAFLSPRSAAMEGFSSKDMAMQMQKKILSRMASKSMVQMFIDDTIIKSRTSEHLSRTRSADNGDKEHKKQVVYDCILVTCRVVILLKSQLFLINEVTSHSPFRNKNETKRRRRLGSSKVEFTFDKAVMAEILTDCRDMLLRLVDKHLTAKSHGRINHVFNHFADTELLTQLYNPGGPFRPNLQKICTGLNKLVEEGKL
uniref:Tumor necrosis factor, alpha-induced protein 8-like 2b n=1 Tax=Lepisosteus oculatus TaxID=7918 RepID=W5MM33_LEPOC